MGDAHALARACTRLVATLRAGYRSPLGSLLWQCLAAARERDGASVAAGGGAGAGR